MIPSLAELLKYIMNKWSNTGCCGGDLKAFLHQPNNNMEQEENSDLLHHLQEKQRRHERFMRAASMLSPTASRSGSMEDINRELQSFCIAY